MHRQSRPEKTFASEFEPIDPILVSPLRVLLFDELAGGLTNYLDWAVNIELQVAQSWSQYEELLEKSEYGLVIFDCLDNTIAYQALRKIHRDTPCICVCEIESQNELDENILQDVLADVVPRMHLQLLRSKILRLLKVFKQLKQVKEWGELLSGFQEISSQHPEVLETLQELVTIKPIDDSKEYFLSEVDLLKAEFERCKKTNKSYESRLLRLLLGAVAVEFSFEFKGLVDPEGNMWSANQSGLYDVGIKRSDVVGKPQWESIWFEGLTDSQEKQKEKIKKAARGEFVRFDIDIRGPDGTIITVDGNLNPIKDRDGQVMFMTVEARDVTEHRRLEKEVARQREALAQLDKIKTQFFANISHEFRTPLTLMLGPIEETLAEVEIASPTTQRERLEIAQRNALRLLKMVNQLLDFSAIEANRIQASFQLTDLSFFTMELASMFRAAIEKAGIILEVDCLSLPEPVYVDRDMWEKIVLNLLSNAFKHTFEGKIKVRLCWDEGQVKLIVQDTGVGIPTVQLPKLFERFQRIPETRSRTHEGSGIGLALVQELAKLHGGTVSVESILGQGTTFTVSVPAGNKHLPIEQIQAETDLEKATSKAQPFIAEAMSWLPQQVDNGSVSLAQEDVSWYKTADGEKVRVLLAEDNADMRSYIERLLSAYCDVESVSDGQAAWDAIRSHPPDLVLSDIMMPKMDGLQLLSALRTDEAFKTIPVVLLSARAGESATVEGLQMGADDYLIKPFDKQELLERVKVNLNLELHRITAEAKKARQISEARFRRMVDSNIIGIFSGRLQDGVITEANDYVLNMLGYTRGELENSQLNWKRLTPPEYEHVDEARLYESLEKGFLMPYEKQYIHKNGYRVDIILGVAILEGSQDDFICYVLDITDRKKAEAALADYAKRLEQSNKELENFATIASHDLQEPLRKILVFTNHLEKTEKQFLSEEGIDDLERIQRATNRMQRLIDDLLDLSRISRRGKPFQPVDLKAVTREVIAELSYPFKDVHERVNLSGSMNIQADPNQMHQMLLQLLDNALKFHKPGHLSLVKITIEHAPEEQCQISISDNGIGMKQNYLHKIFDTFTRLHGTEYAGTGIGLALVKKIVERHNGSIEVQSTPEVGTRFTIMLPLQQRAMT